MKHLLLFAIFLAPSFTSAHDEELPVNSGAELRDWCQHESEAYFVGRGASPFNWTASHVERGNTLVVEGKWRVDGELINVECRAARGAQRRYAVMEVKTEPALK